MDTDIINWKNGDFAVENKLKLIYDYHLSNKTECVFTSKSLKYAIVNKDIELIKQLLNYGVKYDHETCRKCLEESSAEIRDAVLQSKHHYGVLITQSSADIICETSTGLRVEKPINGFVNYDATISGNGTKTPEHTLHVVGNTKLEGNTYMTYSSKNIDPYSNYTVTLFDNFLYVERETHINFPSNDIFKDKLIKVICSIDSFSFDYDRGYPTFHFKNDAGDRTINVESHTGNVYQEEYTIVYTLHYNDGWIVIGLDVIE
jgi:hypothetical protein